MRKSGQHEWKIWFNRSGFSLIYLPLECNSHSRGKGARLVYGHRSQSLDMSHPQRGTRSITGTSLGEVALISLTKSLSAVNTYSTWGIGKLVW